MYIYLLLVTCRMMSLLSIAFNAHILPVLVQPSLERTDCWRIHDMLGEAVPIVDQERLPNWLTANILHTEGIVGKLKRDAKIFGVTSAEKGV